MVVDKHQFMKNLKVISLSLIMIFLGVLATSNISLSSSDNQAYSTLENTDQKVIDSIKESCPNYEGNGDIKGLVTDILKACLGHSGQPPTTQAQIQQSFRKIS